MPSAALIKRRTIDVLKVPFRSVSRRRGNLGSRTAARAARRRERARRLLPLVASGAAAAKGASTPTFAQACGTCSDHSERLLRVGLPGHHRSDDGLHEAVPDREVERPRGSVRDDHAGCAVDARRPEPSGPDAASDDRRSREGRRPEEPQPVLQRVSLEHVPGLAARAASDIDVGRGGRSRPVVRDGCQLQPDRRLLQQGSGEARSG